MKGARFLLTSVILMMNLFQLKTDIPVLSPKISQDYNGTVTFKLLQKARVKFHCDGTVSDIEYKDLTLESDVIPSNESEGDETDVASQEDIAGEESCGDERDITNVKSVAEQGNLSGEGRAEQQSKRLRVRIAGRPARKKKKVPTAISHANVPSTSAEYSSEELDEMDLSSSSDESERDEMEPSLTTNNPAAEAQNTIWCDDGWRIDPRQSGSGAFGPRINIFPRTANELSELDFLLTLLPVDFIRNELRNAVSDRSILRGQCRSMLRCHNILRS